MNVWGRVKKLENEILKTLSKGSQFTVTYVDENKIVVMAHSGTKVERPIQRTVIEGAYKQLQSKKRISLDDVRVFVEFNPVYVLAILETFTEVKMVKEGRKTILVYDPKVLEFSVFKYIPEEVREELDFIEGAVKTFKVNAYERNSKAREACILKHGAICSVCNMDFVKVYGEIGENFIHVHHIIPLSEVKGEYVVNGENDLIPVCPNCHSMQHRKIPPYTVKELKGIMMKIGRSHER